MQEKTYRRLLMLQNALTTMLSHHAGLNPKAFRWVPAPGTDVRLGGRGPPTPTLTLGRFPSAECCTATGGACRTR